MSMTGDAARAAWAASPRAAFVALVAGDATVGQKECVENNGGTSCGVVPLVRRGDEENGRNDGAHRLVANDPHDRHDRHGPHGQSVKVSARSVIKASHGFCGYRGGACLFMPAGASHAVVTFRLVRMLLDRRLSPAAARGRHVLLFDPPAHIVSALTSYLVRCGSKAVAPESYPRDVRSLPRRTRMTLYQSGGAPLCCIVSGRTLVADLLTPPDAYDDNGTDGLSDSGNVSSGSEAKSGPREVSQAPQSLATRFSSVVVFTGAPLLRGMLRASTVRRRAEGSVYGDDIGAGGSDGTQVKERISPSLSCALGVQLCFIVRLLRLGAAEVHGQSGAASGTQGTHSCWQQPLGAADAPCALYLVSNEAMAVMGQEIEYGRWKRVAKQLEKEQRARPRSAVRSGKPRNLYARGARSRTRSAAGTASGSSVALSARAGGTEDDTRTASSNFMGASGRAACQTGGGLEQAERNAAQGTWGCAVLEKLSSSPLYRTVLRSVNEGGRAGRRGSYCATVLPALHLSTCRIVSAAECAQWVSKERVRLDVRSCGRRQGESGSRTMDHLLMSVKALCCVHLKECGIDWKYLVARCMGDVVASDKGVDNATYTSRQVVWTYFVMDCPMFLKQHAVAACGDRIFVEKHTMCCRYLRDMVTSGRFLGDIVEGWKKYRHLVYDLQHDMVEFDFRPVQGIIHGMMRSAKAFLDDDRYLTWDDASEAALEASGLFQLASFRGLRRSVLDMGHQATGTGQGVILFETMRDVELIGMTVCWYLADVKRWLRSYMWAVERQVYRTIYQGPKIDVQAIGMAGGHQQPGADDASGTLGPFVVEPVAFDAFVDDSCFGFLGDGSRDGSFIYAASLSGFGVQAARMERACEPGGAGHVSGSDVSGTSLSVWLADVHPSKIMLTGGNIVALRAVESSLPSSGDCSDQPLMRRSDLSIVMRWNRMGTISLRSRRLEEREREAVSAMRRDMGHGSGSPLTVSEDTLWGFSVERSSSGSGNTLLQSRFHNTAPMSVTEALGVNGGSVDRTVLTEGSRVQQQQQQRIAAAAMTLMQSSLVRDVRRGNERRAGASGGGGRQEQDRVLEVTVDTRELSSCVLSALYHLGCRISLETMAIGDYAAGGLIIERKSIPDLCASLRSGHLADQMRRMLSVRVGQCFTNEARVCVLYLPLCCSICALVR